MKKSPEVEKTKQYYNKKAFDWSAKKTDSFHHEVQFTKITSLWPNKGSIIDIGCAYGIHAPLFLGIGRHLKYFGIDISSSFLKIAHRRYPQLIFKEANIADKTTLPRKKFAGFWAAAVLMHIPFSEWDQMFANIETITKPGSYGYVALPIAHPNKVHNSEDIRHFTILSEEEQRQFFKSRAWRIKSSGTLDGFSTQAVWRWYIVQLP